MQASYILVIIWVISSKCYWTETQITYDKVKKHKIGRLVETIDAFVRQTVAPCVEFVASVIASERAEKDNVTGWR